MWSSQAEILIDYGVYCLVIPRGKKYVTLNSVINTSIDAEHFVLCGGWAKIMRQLVYTY